MAGESARLSRTAAGERRFLITRPYRTPPGPPVILGALIAVALFAQTNLTILVLALIAGCLVVLAVSRARREAQAARAEAAALRERLADGEFAMRSNYRVTWAVDFMRREVRFGDGALELIGRRPTFDDAANAAPSFVHPEDRAEAVKLHEQVLRAGETKPGHLRFVRPDGAVRWVRYALQARRDGEGRLVTIAAVAMDYTDAQERGLAVMKLMELAERELAQHRPELETMLAKIGVDIAPSNLQPDEPLGTPGEGRQINASTARFGRILQEFSARRLAFHAAVTALKEARQNSDVFRGIADTSADSMIVFEDGGIIEWVNPAFERLTGWKLEEVKGKAARVVLAGPDTNQNVIDQLSRDMAARGYGACEVLLYRRDGSTYWADVRCGRTKGAQPRTYVIKRDLTARKQMEAELEAALVEARASDAAKTQFLANMSHELRTPLNAVIGYAEMLQEELGESDNGKDAGRIREAGQHLLAVINGLIDQARLRAQSIDVLVFDDDKTQREAMLRTIARLGFVCASADSLEGALGHAEERPALIIVHCGAADGWTALADLKDAFAGAPLLAIVEPGEGARAIEAGAAAFLARPLGLNGLAAAVARYARRPGEDLNQASPRARPAESAA